MKALRGPAMLMCCSTIALAEQPPQNFTIPVPNGTFELRGVRVAKGGGAINVRGDLVNNTTADWSVVSLRVALYDRQGQTLSVGTSERASVFPVFSVKKGATTKLDGHLFGGNVKGDIARFEITFDEGQYAAIYAFSLAKPSVSPTLVHEDQFLKISFSVPGRSQLAFSLHNKTDNPFKLDWEQVSYVDPEGKSRKVMHQGVRFIERDRAQPPLTIPPGATLEDFAYPSDAVQLLGGQWVTPMLFPDAPKAAALKGKSFSLFMPIEINGATKNYNFVFVIDDIQM